MLEVHLRRFGLRRHLILTVNLERRTSSLKMSCTLTLMGNVDTTELVDM